MASRGESRGWITGIAGVLAVASFALALVGAGVSLEGYSHALHAVALPGATGVPKAFAFNLLAFVVPGVLAAVVALRRRAGLDPAAPLSARLGWTFVLLAALAFAAQGVLPLDLAEPDAGRARLHGVAWGLWGIAFTAAALALALAALRVRRPLAAAGHFGAGILVFSLAWLAADALPVALAQRGAFATWFAWLACVAWAAVPRPR